MTEDEGVDEGACGDEEIVNNSTLPLQFKPSYAAI